MKKSLASILTFFVAFFVLGPLPEGFTASASFVSAPSAVLIDGITGRPIYSKNPNLRRPQASTTKIMTAMVVLDHASLDDIVVIPRSVESVQPSKLYLRGGERYYVRDLIYAILLKSANDAALALAIHVAGSVPAFCVMMDAKSRSIGAKNTKFKTPNGLPAKGQYSTAFDLALIMREATRYPFLVKTLTMKSVSIQSLSGRNITMKSHNKMLWSEKYDVIGKTGYTASSRYCFVGQIFEKYKSVYLGLLGSKSLWTDVRRLCAFPNAKMLRTIQLNQRTWAKHDILFAQEALLNAGYDVGVPDGEFSYRTLAGLESFQRAHALNPSGILDAKTMDVLQNYH